MIPCHFHCPFFVYLLKAKGEVLDKFKAYKAFMENKTDMKIKTLQSNTGGKFVSKMFNDK